MKTLAIIPLLFVSIFLRAQTFAPEGAVWYYSYDPDITLDHGYQKIEVTGDTILLNKNCKVLQKTDIGYSHWDKAYYETDAGQNFVYEEDSVVYFLRDSAFHILYDFTVQAADSFYSISLESTCTESFLVKIDSVTSVDFDGQVLKKFHFNNDYYLEKIGYPDYLFKFQMPCEPLTGVNTPGPLRCYIDNEVGKLSTNTVSACDYIMNTKQTHSELNSVNIYPNPASTEACIYIESKHKSICQISVFNALGQVVETSQINMNENISISIEIPGNYIVGFSDKSGKIVHREKLVVN